MISVDNLEGDTFADRVSRNGAVVRPASVVLPTRLRQLQSVLAIAIGFEDTTWITARGGGGSCVKSGVWQVAWKILDRRVLFAAHRGATGQSLAFPGRLSLTPCLPDIRGLPVGLPDCATKSFFGTHAGGISIKDAVAPGTHCQAVLPSIVRNLPPLRRAKAAKYTSVTTRGPVIRSPSTDAASVME